MLFLSIKTTENPDDLVKNSNSRMSPYLVTTKDDDGRVSEICIAAERQVLIETDDIVTAWDHFFIVFILRLLFEYSKQCHNSFMFVQRKVLNVCDRVKIPIKILLLVDEPFFKMVH